MAHLTELPPIARAFLTEVPLDSEVGVFVGDDMSIIEGKYLGVTDDYEIIRLHQEHRTGRSDRQEGVLAWLHRIQEATGGAEAVTPLVGDVQENTQETPLETWHHHRIFLSTRTMRGFVILEESARAVDDG